MISPYQITTKKPKRRQQKARPQKQWKATELFIGGG